MFIQSSYRYLNILWASKKIIASVAISSILLLAGCGGGSSNNNSNPSAQLRVVHASPDAPAVDVSLGGMVAISSLDYANSSGFLTIDAGRYDISVAGLIPGGNVDVITVDDFALNENDKTTIIAIDEVASIAPLVVSQSSAEPSASEVAVNVIHAAPLAPPVDVYVTAPNDILASATPALSFAFTENVDAGNLAAGPVRIRVTLAGTQTLVYDSGTVDLSAFAGQSILLSAVATTNATSTISSPIKLLAITDSSVLRLFDSDTSAGVKVIHASPDAANAAGGPVEVFATSSELGISPVELIPAFDYTDIVPAANSTVPVPASDDYAFDVAPDTNSITDSVFNVSDVSLVAGAEYSVVATGRVTSTPAFTLLLTEDDNRSIATQARLKVIHAAPAAGDVDIFVTPAGTVNVADIQNETPALSDFSYSTITDYIDLTGGSYDIRVVAGGVVAINVENLSLNNGSVATVIARGPVEPSGNPNDFGVILLTNE